ncbi:hypothetical protein A3H89_01345 [Candidatus Amesbacteria bacterium RIFCSPLOWO2_02_FULL_48_11]|uniref:Uncharacterized protein n=1 Tax=Candidatus Amesbacteria bacterium RIFOXYD1_FULL_47_9 TaxID=1797267 RepID=A0A1F5A386_9BACT|nr:MAG: hypothetical protein A3C34_04360 [Candidatus Amesbacteria bacterium RIFCSPHIGHO2_02_FULL_48_21]OGC99283.1 MAG: hypothetical protein A2W16_02700 [Candidatus Amesbacteria bacterium RBG_16_48_31]OGD05361.1 MAG: hypothetical protein A3H89_01345 [Candidatus Amesbacteria bacterium RIFCSPLOWO2_02_FULL_48_11]OGD12526.1 MAG: hypothetical protein A2576_00765 [Candidatus Amesbacteria bacterium RIFOXYD1_FULL_47_9]
MPTHHERPSDWRGLPFLVRLFFVFPLTLYKRPDGSPQATEINAKSQTNIEVELAWRDHLPKKAGGRVG